ncbi:MAG: class I SAM-dependent methyltransferase [Chitinispirillia bacterium]|jgi:SAM-dependent methyltransferase
MRKTWNEFWGEFLPIQFHKDNTDRWTEREKRAKWIVDLLDLSPGSNILELGCGDGLLDICLGRLGMDVTGVDRIEKVMELAKSEVKHEQVRFMDNDIRSLKFPEQSYDCILIFEVIGLMRKNDDINIITRSAEWLKSGGSIVIDCPKEPKENISTRKWSFPEGHLTFNVRYNPNSKKLEIIPLFIRNDGTEITLFDSFYNNNRAEGIQRYIYPIDELKAILEDSGLMVKEINNFFRPDHYALHCHKLC